MENLDVRRFVTIVIVMEDSLPRILEELHGDLHIECARKVIK